MVTRRQLEQMIADDRRRLDAIEQVQAAHGSAIATLATQAHEHDMQPTGPLMGVAMGAGDDEFQALEAIVGPLAVRRSFDPGLVADFADSNAAFDVGHRASVWSFKIGGDYRGFAAGSWDDRIHALLDSIPAGHPCTLVMQHEPENDPGIVASDWRAAQARFGTLVRSHGRPELDWAFVLMAWSFDARSGRDPQDWCDATMLATDPVCGIDVYQDVDSPWVPWADRVEQLEPAVAWGCRVGLAEYGFPDRDDGEKVRHLADVHAWATALGSPWLCYFNVVSGIASADETYLLTSSPEVVAEYAREAAA